MNDKQIAWLVAEFLGLTVHINPDNGLAYFLKTEQHKFSDPSKSNGFHYTERFNPYDSDIVLRCMEKGGIAIDANNQIEEGKFKWKGVTFTGIKTEWEETIPEAVINCVVAICDCDFPKELG